MNVLNFLDKELGNENQRYNLDFANLDGLTSTSTSITRFLIEVEINFQ